MKRLLISLIALIGVVGTLYAAEPFDAATVLKMGASAELTGIKWTYFVIDSFTIKPLSLTKHIHFTTPLYNVQVRVLNAGADSGYVTMTMPSNTGSIVNAKSCAIALKTFDIWRVDTAFLWMGVSDLDFLAKKGGNADSACTIQILGVR